MGISFLGFFIFGLATCNVAHPFTNSIGYKITDTCMQQNYKQTVYRK